MLNKISHYALATFYNAFLGIFSIFILTKYYDFSDFGKKTEDFYSLKRLDPGYRIYYGQNAL